MKRFKPTLFALVMLGLAPAGAWAATPGSGLLGTAHDWSGQSVKGGNNETFTTGLCTFCHTPHRGLSTSLLWNHTLSTNTFSWDASQTTVGTKYPSFKGDTYKGPTAKCLSCHDGSVAIGDVAWFGEGKPQQPLDTTKHGSGDPMNVGYGGAMKGTHPVAMPYPYLGVANTYNTVTTSGQALSGYGFVASEWQSTPVSPIRVFNDDGTGNVTPGPVATKTGIECSSCHDPHNKAAVDDLFLRGTVGGNTTAYICLKCHIK